MSINSYLNRALKSKDPRFALILTKIKSGAQHPTVHIPKRPTASRSIDDQPSNRVLTDNVQSLRDKFKSLYGVDAPKGWNKKKLMAKIAEKVG